MDDRIEKLKQEQRELQEKLRRSEMLKKLDKIRAKAKFAKKSRKRNRA